MFNRRFILLGSLIFFNHAAAVAEEPSALLNLQRITYDGNSIAPVFSPKDNNLIAFTEQKYAGIYLLNMGMKRTLSAGGQKNGVIEKLNDEAESGFGFSWAENGRNIVFRGQVKQGEEHAAAIDIKTKEAVELASGKAGEVSLPVIEKNGVFLAQGKNNMRVQFSESGKLMRRAQSAEDAKKPAITEKYGRIYRGKEMVSKPDTECWLPALSPDEQKIVFECWQGLYVYHVPDKKLVFLDVGTSPRWAADSTKLVYELTEDDGHQVIKSEVFLIQAGGGGKIHLSAGTDAILRRPALSADGKKLAVDIEGDIYLADIAAK